MLSSADRVAHRPLFCGTSTTPARAAPSLSSSTEPSTRTVPATEATAGRMAPASAHSSDDLPAPDGPVTDSTRPPGTCRSQRTHGDGLAVGDAQVVRLQLAHGCSGLSS